MASENRTLNEKIKKQSIRQKFSIGSAVILLLFCTLLTVFAYFYLKQLVIDDIFRETEIFIGTADATRTYVKDILRPRVSKLLLPEEFIPHAMSTTYVGREIMGRLQQRFPDFDYKRVAKNPINPVNQADAFEMEMLEWFDANRNNKEWYGLIKKDDRSYYTRLRAIYAEPECLLCHGDPKDSPSGVREIYGTEGGYHYEVGKIVAADTVYIPVDVTFERVKEIAWQIFFFAVVALFGLMFFFYLLFNRTVVAELKGLLYRFRRISDEGGELEEAEASGDEIDQLKLAFEQAAVDLQRVHDELRASESKFRMMFESSQDAILIVDGETAIQDINLAGLQLFGLMDKKEALSIETSYQLFWDTRDAESFFKTMIREGRVRGMEVPMVDKIGRRMTVMISATARKDDAGKFAGGDVVMRDITEKMRMEKYLAQTEKLASIGQLASGIAHEINNPLGVIQCYADLVIKGESAESQTLSDVRIIRKHTEQCKQVVEALLNFARLSEPQKALTDIRQCVADVLSVLVNQFEKAGITIVNMVDRDLPDLVVDAQKIKQVLMNLLLNARQATSEGGRITVASELRPDALCIVVSDTGTGISPIHIDRIFDPFFTTKGPGKGTGLGLSVSYGIIKQHGGDIEVDSRISQGSTFRVVLPLDSADTSGDETK